MNEPPPLRPRPARNSYLIAFGIVATLAATGVLGGVVATGLVAEVFTMQWTVALLLVVVLVAAAAALFWTGGWRTATVRLGWVIGVSYLVILAALYVWIGWRQTPHGMPIEDYLAAVAIWAALAGIGIAILLRFDAPVTMAPWLAALLQRDRPAPPLAERVALRYYFLRLYAYLFCVLALVYLVGFVGWHYVLFRPPGGPPLAFEPLVLLGELMLAALAAGFFVQIHLFADDRLTRERAKERREARRLPPRPAWQQRAKKSHPQRRYRITIRHPKDVPVEVQWDVDGQEPGAGRRPPRA